MEAVFVKISLKSKEDKIDKKRKHHLREWTYKKYLLHRLTVEKKEIIIGKEKGIDVILPFTKEEAKKFGSPFVEKFLKKLEEKEAWDAYYLSPELRDCLSYSITYCTWFLKYILFPQTFKKIMKQYHLDSKYMRLVIVDSGDEKVEYFIKTLLLDLNHLTIATKRPDYFAPLVEKCYEETGLMIEIAERPLKEGIEGDVIIDASGDCYKEYLHFDEKSIILSMNQEKNKIAYLLNRKKERKIIYDITYRMHGEYVEEELLAELIRRKDWRMNQLVQRGFGSLGDLELDSLCEGCGLELERLKVL